MTVTDERQILPFDLDLIFGHPKFKKQLQKVTTPRGVFRIIHGSTILDGNGNGIAVATEQPGGGRIWFLRTFALLDAQNPQTVSLQNPTVTNVALGATTVATSNLNSFPVNVTVAGGTVTAISINGVTTNATSGTFLLQPGGLIAITYSAPPVLTTAAVSQIASGVCSIYAEPTPPNFTSTGTFAPNPPNPNGVIVPSFTGVPTSVTFTNWAYKIANQENLYAVVKGMQGTSGQIGFIARVSEYYQEDVELMHT